MCGEVRPHFTCGAVDSVVAGLSADEYRRRYGPVALGKGMGEREGTSTEARSMVVLALEKVKYGKCKKDEKYSGNQPEIKKHMGSSQK